MLRSIIPYNMKGTYVPFIIPVVSVYRKSASVETDGVVALNHMAESQNYLSSESIT